MMYREIFMDLKVSNLFNILDMVCPIPPLYDEEDLDVTPLNHYWLLIKFIMVCLEILLTCLRFENAAKKMVLST